MEGEERIENSTVDIGVGHLKITWQVSLVNKRADLPLTYLIT